MHPEYRKKRREYENSIGFEIYNNISGINIYLRILDGNLNIVLKNIEYYESNYGSLWAIEDVSNQKRRLDEFSREFLRVLFNYLMSVSALSDKIISWRNHLNNKFNNRIIKKEYSLSLERLGVLKYGSFLKKVRNELTHGSNNVGFSHITYSVRQTGKEGVCASIFYSEINEKISAVAIYHSKAIHKFQKWFIQDVTQKFAKEIKIAKELNYLLLKMQETLSSKHKNAKPE